MPTLSPARPLHADAICLPRWFEIQACVNGDWSGNNDDLYGFFDDQSENRFEESEDAEAALDDARRWVQRRLTCTPVRIGLNQPERDPYCPALPPGVRVHWPM